IARRVAGSARRKGLVASRCDPHGVGSGGISRGLAGNDGVRPRIVRICAGYELVVGIDTVSRQQILVVVHARVEETRDRHKQCPGSRHLRPESGGQGGRTGSSSHLECQGVGPGYKTTAESKRMEGAVWWR